MKARPQSPLVLVATVATVLLFVLGHYYVATGKQLLPSIIDAVTPKHAQHTPWPEADGRVHYPNHTVVLCTTATVFDLTVATGWHPAQPGLGPFWASAPKAPGEKYTRGLAMARLSNEDVGWIDEAGLDVEQYVYVVDDRQARFSTPANKGNEAMAYLTYIIDHYDTLPDITLFMHSHRYADHNDAMLNRDAVEVIRRLDSEHVMREGYVNLNCARWEDCHTLYKYGFKPLFGDALFDLYARTFPGRETPWMITAPCCGQFAVSRDRIKAASREQYVSFRDWILQSELSDYESGRVWEYFWHILFTGLETRCPDGWACLCRVYGICFRGPHEVRLWDAMLLRSQEIGKRTWKIDGLLGSSREEDDKLRLEKETLEKEREELDAKREQMRQVAIERGYDPSSRDDMKDIYY
ncbi:hypothetical protein ANO11243_034930 [Dothideomycetidae sp. 11243]|nr:hypothetical protein ANO11243_034930 [fungal sp. No.11243]